MTTPEKPDRRKGRDRSHDKGRARLFTEISVTKTRLAKDESEATYRDRKAPGLLLKLKKSGAKGWRVQFYDASLHKMRTEALGEFEPGHPAHMSVKDARKAAMNFRANLDSILSARAQQALANRASFNAVADWYMGEFVEGQRRSASQIKAVIEAVKAEWGNKPFEGISRSDVWSLLDKIAKARGPRAADVTLAILRRMMDKHAARSESYASVIVKGMSKIENPKERARDRILTDQEIRLMFTACAGLGTFGNMVKVLLYTAQRRSKVATMRFDDVDAGVWTIPTEKREKGNAQRLKLPKHVLEIIGAQAQVQLNEFVFPASRLGRREGDSDAYGSYSAFGQGKSDLDAAMAKLQPKPIPHWTLHDIRRTARSLMARAGIRPDIAERVLGHAIAGVEGVYDRHDYDTERETALMTLATLIGEITAGRR